MKFDAFGVQGSIFHYALVCALVGSAFLVWLYCWKKGRLDMEEEPKMRMLQQDDRICGQEETKPNEK